MMNSARRARSKSPFASRRGRSKSPFARRRRAKSPLNRLVRRAASEDDEVHESEIVIFKQLCLDKHDGSAAIEIQLEDFSSDIPSLAPAASTGSTEASPNVVHKLEKTPESVERKKPFLNRFLKGHRKTSAVESLPTKTSSSRDNSGTANVSETGEKLGNLEYLPAPSRVPSTRREHEESKVPYKISERAPSSRSQEFSHISSLSGTRGCSFDRSFETPLQLNRHESLGNESIKDIRKALKEMEKQLGTESSKGKRISRQKVMRALFSVADSLDDLEESDMSDDGEDNFTQTSHTVFEDEDDASLRQDKENVPFNLFSSVGKLFGTSKDDKNAVERVLDDLLWTEFVTARQTCSANKDSRLLALDGNSVSEEVSNWDWDSETDCSTLNTVAASIKSSDIDSRQWSAIDSKSSTLSKAQRLENERIESRLKRLKRMKQLRPLPEEPALKKLDNTQSQVTAQPETIPLEQIHDNGARSWWRSRPASAKSSKYYGWRS
jgi:hypothetical protein